MKHRPIRAGEPLAVDPRAIHTDRKSIWWDYSTMIPPNESVALDSGGCVQVVHIRGSLEHHAGIFGDSYEGIRERITEACSCDDTLAVVLRFDSPGGVVSGLAETTRWIRKMAKTSGMPIVAYVDELCASAAYNLACGCSSISAPRDAIIGSIGTIATMYDQSQADKKMGLRFVTLKSGDRKDDGHPHVPISDQAIAVEQNRIEKLAFGFYKIVSEARAIPLKELTDTKGFQAGIFLAPKAAAMGLIDTVDSWEAFLAALPDALSQTSLDKPPANTSSTVSDKSRSKGNETDRRALSKGSPMNIQLASNVRRLEAAIAAETDPDKKTTMATQLNLLKAAIEAGKQVVHEKHEKKTVKDDGDGSTDDDGDDDGDEPDGDEEEDEEESADMGGDDGDDDGDDDSDDDSDDAEEDEEEAEEEEAKYAEEDEAEAKKYASTACASLSDPSARNAVKRAVRSAVLATRKSMRSAVGPVLQAARKATGQRSPKAIVGALQAMPARLKSADKVAGKVARLEQSRRRDRVNAMLKDAKRSGKVTPAQMDHLRASGMKDPGWLKGYLATLPVSVRKAGFVAREGTAGDPIGPNSDEQSKMRAAAMANLSAEEKAAFEKHEKEVISRASKAPRF